jgi:tetratricopeptide (TPR) repeat protein
MKEKYDFTEKIKLAEELFKKRDFNKADKIYKDLFKGKNYTYELLISCALFNRNIKRYKIAQDLLTLSIRKYPKGIKSYLLLSEIYISHKNFKEAEKLLFTAQKIDKSNSFVYYRLATIYFTNKNYESAIKFIDIALNINPNKNEYYILKADLLFNKTEYKKALHLLSKINVEKKSSLFLQRELLLSNLYLAISDFKKAESTLLNLKSVFKKEKIIFLSLSNLYFQKKDLKKGILILQEGLILHPNFLPFKFNLAVIYRNSGDIKLAIDTHLEIIRIDNSYLDSYYELSSLYDFRNHKKELELFLNIDFDKLSSSHKIKAAFSKSNIFHNLKEYTKSSNFLKIANEEKLKLYPSDLEIKKNTGEFYKKLSVNETKKDFKNNNAAEIVFIVGMPRSGSTLLENIISVKNDVIDMGEVSYFEQSLNEIIDIKDIFSTYVSKIKDNKNNYIFTDKNLFNFLYCPVIYNYFPSAKIIHCIRNPLDNILSIYRTNFLKQNFSSSLIDITDLYIYQHNLMKNYKKLFGQIIYSYKYDDLVKNPSIEIPKLIEWLGWEWDENFLNPHINKRNVFTASSAQVRNKINNKAIGNWTKYEDILRPAIDLIKKSKLLEDM